MEKEPLDRSNKRVCLAEMEEQQEKLYRSYNNWKRGYTQIDDVCVMGIRIE